MKYGIRGGFVAVVLASLLFWSGCEEARAFVDPPVLVPEHPQALQPVYVRLRWGGCDGLDLPTPENIFIEPTGPQSIRVRISGEHYDGGPWCLFGQGTTADYPIGSFPSGTYQVEVQHIYDTIIGEEIATLGVLELQVAPADLPLIVPATGNDMLWALALLVILTAGVAFRRIVVVPAFVIASSLMFSPNESRADAFVHLLLSDDSGASSPQEIAEEFDFSSGNPPPLQGLIAEHPTGAAYLLPIRARGAFRAYLDAYPDSPRAKLERYLIVQYPDGADIDAALNALNSDPDIQHAAGPLPMDFSSASKDQGVPPKGGTEPYGRAALNVESSWVIAGGWGLVATIDSRP